MSKDKRSTTPENAATKATRKFLNRKLGYELTGMIATGSGAGTQARLSAAQTAFRTIVKTGASEDLARAWMIGCNPQLDDLSPIEALVRGRAEDIRNVLAAARAYE